MMVVVPLRMHSIRGICAESVMSFAVDSLVHFPPQAFENLHKVRSGFARDGHTARHGGIEMVVGADEAGQDDLPRTVHSFSVRKTFFQF